MRATAKLESEQKAFKLQKSKLEQQLKISEHRVKAKEGLLERLQHKFQQVMDKEDVSKTRTREVFRTIQQRDPRKSSAADLKSLELIAMYETEREKMTAEIAQLRSQVQELCCDVRDKENVLLRQTGANGFTQRDAFVEKLEQARLEQEQSSRQLRHKEAIIQEKVNKIEIELRHSKDIIADLRDENANLILEVQSRPTIRDYKAIQRRVVLLERQLSDQKAAVQDAHTLEDLRKYMGTAELIHRDKVNAKLHLNRLTTLPKEACLDVIQDICRQLDLTDVTLIGPSVAKLISVVQAVPRMEKFIHGVCGCISQNGIVPLEIVTSTLTKWKNDLTHLAQLQSFTDKLHAILSRRSHDNVQDIQGPISHNRALHVVEELVAFETHFSHEREMYSLAITNVDVHEHGERIVRSQDGVVLEAARCAHPQDDSALSALVWRQVDGRRVSKDQRSVFVCERDEQRARVHQGIARACENCVCGTRVERAANGAAENDRSQTASTRP
ncbi:hypothetical protein, variant 6 [Aphanomyces invadans]|nr:hypothetical protein, variant 6 [Aphanomyces invadans]ETV93992.1 hypothetical protein, variant 6 [Aphanomyces invadans]|eukprot:XP_008877194.1 hypothetical protein, variant 6 [Aphanomyces invadans]